MTSTFTDPTLFSERSDKFARRIHLRNAIEYAAGGACALAFAAIGIAAAIHGQGAIALACVLLVVGIAAVVWKLSRDGRPSAALPEQPCSAFLRAELVRQRTLLQAVPRWYLAPLVPGITAFYGAIFWNVASQTSARWALQESWHVPAIIAGMFAGIVLLNRHAANRLTNEIAAIDALG